MLLLLKISSGALILSIVVSVTAFAQKPELVVQTGHANSIQFVAFSHDGKTLASASLNDKTIKLWHVSTGRELRALTGHSEGVNTVAFSPDDRILASGSHDKTIKFWEVATGRELRALSAQPFRVTSIAFSPDGKILAGGGYNNQSQDQHNMIKLWEVATGRELRTLAAHPLQCNTVAFSPDGKILASGSDDRMIKLWDIATGRELRTLRGHSDKVTSVAFSPDGKVLASGSGNFVDSRDNTVRFWDVATGRELRTLAEHSGMVVSVAFSPDGKTLASADNSDEKVKLREVATGKELPSLMEHSSDGTSSSITSIAFSPDGRILAGGSPEKKIILWDVTTGRERHILKGHVSSVDSIAFSPDGKILASKSDFGIKFWSASKECRTFTKEPSFSFAFSPDGRTLAEGNYQGIVLREVATGAEMRKLTESFEGFLPLLVFSPEGKILAGVGIDNKVKLWDVATGKKLGTFVAPTVDRVFSVAFSPDGAILAGAGNANNAERNNERPRMIVLWDVATGHELRNLAGHSYAVRSVAFTPDGKTLASGGLDNMVKLWDVATGGELRTLRGHTDWVEAVAFSPDGKILASGSDDRMIRLWDIATGRELRTLAGHSEAVTSVAFSPDGKTLMSGGRDAKMKLWEASTGRELASLLAIDESDWLVITPDGLFDGSPAAWNQILWRFAQNTFDVAPVEAFFNEFYYPDLLADLLAGRKISSPRNIAQLDRQQPRLKMTLGGGQVSPDSGLTTRTAAVRIEVEEARAGAQDVRLFRNGSLVKVWRGDVLKGQSKATLETTIPVVAGENRLTAYAFNRDNVKSADATLMLTGAEGLQRKGTGYVLAVGVNSYANPQYNLKYAVADAQAFGEEWKRQQEKLGNYERIQVIPLYDREATKANVLQSLKQLAATVQPEDAVVVYFAGHGTAAQDRFYLIPHDLGYTGSRKIDQAGLETILAHSISDRELEQGFEKIDAGQLLIVIDACNSGQALETEEKRRGPMNSKGLAQLAYEKGMYILTAAQSFQFANEEPRLGHGFLTYALIEEGLKSSVADKEPADGVLIVREWFDYATERVPRIYKEQIGKKSEGQLAQLRSRKVRELGLSAVDDVQQPRVFYRRELEARPLIVARPDASPPRE